MGNLIASHTVEINKPLAEVYEVIADVPASPAWQPSVKEVEVLESDSKGRTVLAVLKTDAVVKETTQRVRFSYQPPDAMSWTQEKGDVKSLDGSWKLVETADGTQATFALDVDPGRMLGMLLRGPVADKAKDFLTRGAAEGLKEHMESGGG